jgi:cell division transport system permease protein
MTKAMGTDPSQFLEYNPFYASLNVRLEPDYACNDSLKIIEKRIAAMEGVREVTWQKDLLDIINSNIRKVAGLLLILAMILSLVSFTLINNTIKLTIYAQRFVLYSMKLVGAKWSFIRKPFISRNLMIGLVSAILTCIIIWYGLKIGLKYEPWLIMLAEPRIIIPVFVVVTLIGLLITGACALHSVNRFLRMKSGELHYV